MDKYRDELFIQKFNKINYYKKIMSQIENEAERKELLNEIEALSIQIENLIEGYKDKEKNERRGEEEITSFRVREFTLSEITNYDGTDDKLAYIAVNGTVYDITGHKIYGQIIGSGFKAGTDLSDQFNSGKFNKSSLVGLRIVGVLKQ